LRCVPPRSKTHFHRNARLRQLMKLPSGPYPLTRCVLSLCALLWLLCYGFPARYNHAEILAALRMTESSGMANPPDGDKGTAIGPYQIHKLYWMDAKIPGDYQQCREQQYAERVIKAYMLRYATDAWLTCDAEIIARTHNGGPTGRHKNATDKYWARMSKWLRQLPRRSSTQSPNVR
jgi:hypothetical protein